MGCEEAFQEDLSAWIDGELTRAEEERACRPSPIVPQLRRAFARFSGYCPARPTAADPARAGPMSHGSAANTRDPGIRPDRRA